MTEKNKGNPVSNRSKRQIETALLKLMQTDDFKEITIQEIAYHAGLSRRTFYRNYSSKEEILEGCFYTIWNEYRALIQAEEDLSLPNIARIFFGEMQKHIEFLITVNRHGLLPLFLTKVDVLLPTAFDEIKGETVPFSKENIRYALTFSAGGFIRILVLWLNDGACKSPDEMASIVKDFISIGQYP